MSAIYAISVSGCFFCVALISCSRELHKQFCTLGVLRESKNCCFVSQLLVWGPVWRNPSPCDRMCWGVGWVSSYKSPAAWSKVFLAICQAHAQPTAARVDLYQTRLQPTAHATHVRTPVTLFSLRSRTLYQFFDQHISIQLVL